MYTTQKATVTDPQSTAEALYGPMEDAEWVSTWVDGECQSPEADAAWGRLGESTDALVTWHMHHLIGDMLRGDALASSAGQQPLSSLAFAAQVVALARSDSGAKPVLQAAPLHETAVAMGRPDASISTDRGAGELRPVRQSGAAANDSVFRWKAVAGLAVFGAALSLTWTVWNTGGQTDTLAQAPAAPTTQQARAPDPVATPVWVASERGLVERDARLDALLQAHRQSGGATAWQLPAGFMRASAQSASQP